MHGYSYDYLSGTVTIPYDAPQAWRRDGLDSFYFDPNNPDWDEALSPILSHGSLHLWQFFASGYLANLVADDWQRLNDFEATGQVPERTNSLKTHTQCLPDQPFSAYQLVECWARFWEVQVRGPDRATRDEGIEVAGNGDDLALWDGAMGQGPDAGIYGPAYQWIFSTAHGDIRLVQLAFPIIAHHAFGSTDPVGLFCEAFTRACRSQPIAERARQASQVQADDWTDAWHPVFSEAVLPVLMERALPSYASGFEVMERGPLRDHPIFREYVEMLDGLQTFLKNPQAYREEVDPTLQALEEPFLDRLFEFARHDLWAMFAMPGQAAFHYLLGHFLPPPKVVCENFTFSLRRPSIIRHREVQAGASNVAETYADRSADLERRIHRFRAAERAVSLGLPPGAFETPRAAAETV